MMKSVFHKISCALRAAAVALAGLVGVATVSAQIHTDRVINIGRNALYFEDYMLAIQYFNQAISSKPYLAQPYFLRAIAKLNLEDYEGAEADASKAIELNEFITDAWEVRGVARQNLGKASEAISDYTRALKLVPRNRQLLFNKALAQETIEAYGGADSTYDELLRYYPNFDNGYLGRARLRMAQADTVAARADINRALELNPQSATAYVMRAEINIHTPDSTRAAMADLDEAIRLQPKYTGLYINRAFLRYQADDYFGAMADYDYALQLEPYNPTALFNRAMLLAEVNANDRALVDLDRVLELDPDNVQARYMRATVRGRKGMYADAVKDITAVIDRFPDYPGAWLMRSQFNESMGRASQSRSDYNKAIALSKALPINGNTDRNDAPEPTIEQTAEAEARRFNTLLTVEGVAEINEEYNNQAIRGKVQDRNIQVETAPMMELSYYCLPDELSDNTYYAKEVADLNAGHELRYRLMIAAGDAPADDERFDSHRRSIDYYNSYMSAHTPRAVDYFGRAMDYATLRDYESALRDADRVVAITPDYALGYMLRAQLRHRRLRLQGAEPVGEGGGQSRMVMQRAGLAEVIADLDKAVELSPSLAPAWFNKGNAHLEAEDYTSAIASYTRAIELAPAMGQAYFNRGYIYLKLGNRSAGIADLSKAGELGVLPAYNLMKRITAN